MSAVSHSVCHVLREDPELADAIPVERRERAIEDCLVSPDVDECAKCLLVYVLAVYTGSTGPVTRGLADSPAATWKFVMIPEPIQNIRNIA